MQLEQECYMAIDHLLSISTYYKIIWIMEMQMRQYNVQKVNILEAFQRGVDSL